MIITKTPFRISFAGGGSDLKDYYSKKGGCVLSTTINKYMYISVHPYFDETKISLKYSENEIVSSISEIKHRIMNAVMHEKKIQGVEISSTADIPSGTGLGSSSTFTVGLLHTLACYEGKYRSKHHLAYDACNVEINKLGNPIGKQDQYAAAFGGLNFIQFKTDDSVEVSPILMQPKVYKNLQSSLMMFYTGDTRSANGILSEQKQNMAQKDKIAILDEMCHLCQDMKKSLEENDLSMFGTILNEGWYLKKKLASGISSLAIDEMYQKAISNGAKGGKLLGAGGGGFFLFYVEPEHQEKVRIALGLKQLDFSFENDGSSVIYIGDKYWD